MPVELIIGPPTNQMSRTAAEQALVGNPQFPKDAEYDIQSHAGHWIAAVHVAAPPPFPPKDDEAAGPPAPDGPSTDDAGAEDAGSDDSGDDSGGEEKSEGPPKDKEKGGEKGELHQVMQFLTLIMDALGISPDAGGLAPGPDDGMGGPPGPPPPHAGPHPPGAGGPPGAGAHPPRPMRPGETPPGGTPIGAPAFASVQPDHPWAHTIGQVPHFKVAEPLNGQPLEEAEAELQSVASAGGFKVANVKPARADNGEMMITAVIQVPKPE
jgi:hypothetical protein